MNAAPLVKYNHSINRCHLEASIHWDGWASHIPNVMEVLRSSVPRSLFPFSWNCYPVQANNDMHMPSYARMLYVYIVYGCRCRYTGTECISLTSKRLANGKLQFAQEMTRVNMGSIRTATKAKTRDVGHLVSITCLLSRRITRTKNYVLLLLCGANSKRLHQPVTVFAMQQWNQIVNELLFSVALHRAHCQLHHFFRHKQLWTAAGFLRMQALHLLGILKEKQLQPNSITYCNTISACARCQDQMFGHCVLMWFYRQKMQNLAGWFM